MMRQPRPINGALVLMEVAVEAAHRIVAPSKIVTSLPVSPFLVVLASADIPCSI